jgi:hypothetical protein
MTHAVTVKTIELAGFGVERGTDGQGNKLFRMTVDGKDGSTLYALFSNPNELFQMAGNLTKAAVDGVADALIGSAPLKTQTHISMSLEIIGQSPTRVLVVKTTDNLELRISVSDQQAVCLGDHLK